MTDKRHITSKFKGQGHLSVWQLLSHMSRTKSPRNTKIGGKIAHPTGNNAHDFRGQKINGQGHQAD